MRHTHPRQAQFESSFPRADLRTLLATNGIGPVVVQRLEQAGFSSLEQLRSAGAERAAAAVCQLVGSEGWANRRRAIQRAIEGACTHPLSS